VAGYFWASAASVIAPLLKNRLRCARGTCATRPRSWPLCRALLLKMLLNGGTQRGIETNKERQPSEKAQTNQSDLVRAATDREGLIRISTPVP
jgi:hypothetical protein